MPLLAASLTSDPRQVSLVSVFGGLPWLFFALHSGALADRWNRLKTMWVCDASSGVLIAAFAVLVAFGRFDLFILCGVAFLTGSISTLFDSASQAALPAIVPVEQRAHANSWLYTGTVLAGLFVGPPLGSWAYGLAESAPLWVEAGGFFISAVLILAMRTDLAARGEKVVSATYRQSAVPDALQGRVNGAYRFATWGITPLGAAFGGRLAYGFGLPAVFLAASVILAIIGLITLPQLTNERLRSGSSQQVN